MEVKVKKTTVIIILSLLTLVLCALNATGQSHQKISHKNYEEKPVRLEGMLKEIQRNVKDLKKLSYFPSPRSTPDL